MSSAADETRNAEGLAFSVDTHLLRELGALLVGRDSTALVELIKNAYDADATHVVVHGERLGEHGAITVVDDGHGMTYQDFITKFLRIAGRSKEKGKRRSPRYKRRYTGAKGIGRLSSHKLGERLVLESTPDPMVAPSRDQLESFRATIDWPAIERSEASIDATRVIRAERLPAVGAPGTSLAIHALHSAWSSRQLNEFLAEVRSTRPDAALTDPLPPGTFAGDAVVPSIAIVDTGPDDPGFQVEMSGAFAGTDSQWPTLVANVAWLIEIDARERDTVVYRVTPSRRIASANSSAEQREYYWARRDDGPRFVSRIFVRETLVGSTALRDMLSRFAKQAAGVRVFLEGFRVLPYGAPRNDWLGIDRQYTARGALAYIDEIDDPTLEQPSRTAVNERTYRLSNDSYFGAVFLHEATNHGLQMVVNREGFLPGDAFDQIVEIVTRGININTRMRAALGARTRAEKAEAESRRHTETLEAAFLRSKKPEQEDVGLSEQLRTWIDIGRQAAAGLRQTSVLATATAQQDVTVVQSAFEELKVRFDAATEEQSQLRVLASLGTQLGAFVHEVNSVVGQAISVRDALDQLLSANEFSDDVQQRLRAIGSAQNDLIGSLERQAVYLSDSFGAEATRRRSRQRLAERWDTASRLTASAAERRQVQVANAIPADLRSPPMFAAEVNVIFTNLLTNAIKAAARGDTRGPRRVVATGNSAPGRVTIRVENTGDRVDLKDGERWFRPFETTTIDMDEVLGQGLGLGLPLTRRIVEEYGGRVVFAQPSSAMSTCVELSLPHR